MRGKLHPLKAHFLLGWETAAHSNVLAQSTWTPDRGHKTHDTVSSKLGKSTALYILVSVYVILGSQLASGR